ncbi:hypothetical protein [Phycicoccus sp.]|uniref:hypothetical protein n=1 Tax=Phycicoccus sp. TaxID=1902410 RepID=UPI002B669F3B|nr:hypothetical protein [Phycicoccus sp.]HMM95355.1 hypothetical protein [Phycicoccus sp.]
MQYLNNALYFAGCILVAVGSARPRATKLSINRWQTIGFALLVLGFFAEAAIDEHYGPTMLWMLFAATVAAGILGWLIPRSALPCLIGRHSDRIVNVVSAESHDGTVELRFEFGAITDNDRELLLTELLPHGRVVRAECAKCGANVAKHAGPGAA